MTTYFVAFTSTAVWKHAANATMQQPIPVRQHFVGQWQFRRHIQLPRNHAPSFGWCYTINIWNWMYQDFCIGKCQNQNKIHYHSRILEQRKNKKWGRQKNASAKLKCLSKTKMPPINWRHRRPSQAFFLPFGFSRCVLMGISTSGFGNFCFEAGACGEIEIWRILSWHGRNMSKLLKEHENQNMGLFWKTRFFPR